MATRTTGNRVWKLSWIKSLYTHTASILRGIIYNVGQGNKLCYINYKHITYIRRKSNIMFWSLGMYSPNFLIIAYCTIRYYGSTRCLRTNERVSQPNFNKNLSPVPVHKDVIWGPTSLKFKFFFCSLSLATKSCTFSLLPPIETVITGKCYNIAAIAIIVFVLVLVIIAVIAIVVSTAIAIVIAIVVLDSVIIVREMTDIP